MYVDASNLCGWAMSQPLPFEEFKWMSTMDIDNFGIHNVPIDSKHGYFLEVVLIYSTVHMTFIMIFYFVRQIVCPQKRIHIACYILSDEYNIPFCFISNGHFYR